jgi:hypothetical protein
MSMVLARFQNFKFEPNYKFELKIAHLNKFFISKEIFETSSSLLH